MKRRRDALDSDLASLLTNTVDEYSLADGDRIAVVGGGPAGSFFSFFVRRMADSIGLKIEVDLFEPRLFDQRGPAGCNHCGGVVSESLVQILATEGIVIPPEIIQRGIDSYVLHMDVGQVSIEAASLEKRIAAVYRGNGPRHSEPIDIIGFDRFLLELCEATGTTVIRKLVDAVDWREGKPQVVTADGQRRPYELVAIACGVNSRGVERFRAAAPQYEPPRATMAFICEFKLGEAQVNACLGAAMHVFLLDLPHLEFAALIPKGDFITLCLIGEEITEELVSSFLSATEVSACFPGGVVPSPVCHCFPRINVRAADHPFGDRVVWIGDSGVCKLYKDGIGSAYRTSKAAAATAVFRGVSARDFEHRFLRECDSLRTDNSIARFIFAATKLIQKTRFLRHGVLRMVAHEGTRPPARRYMSNMLWDVFTGSAPYKEILLRSMNLEFPAQLVWNVAAGNCARAVSAHTSGGPKR